MNRANTYRKGALKGFSLFFSIYCLGIAGNLHSQDFAENTLHEGSAVFMNGLGHYETLNEDIFLGAIFLPSMTTSISPDTSIRLEMHIASEALSARRFSRLWLDAITLNTSREEREGQIEQIQAFSEAFSESMQQGDHVNFDYIYEEDMTHIYLNRIKLGQVQGRGFFDFLVTAWIGESPMSETLKAGLTNTLTGEEDSENAEAFAALQFSQSRLEEIDAALNFVEEQAENELIEQELQAENERQRIEAERLLWQEELLRQQQVVEAEAEAKALAELELKRAEEEELRLSALEEARLFAEEQQQLTDVYIDELTVWIGQYLSYPQTALMRNIEGKVELEITSDREGMLLSNNVTNSAESSILDNAAIGIVEDAEPFPEMPQLLAGDSFTFNMPINFSLQD